MGRAKLISGTLATLDMKEGQIPVVSDFQDVLSKEYDLPLEMRVEVSIDLIPRVAPVSTTPYYMSQVELEKVKA